MGSKLAEQGRASAWALNTKRDKALRWLRIIVRIAEWQAEGGKLVLQWAAIGLEWRYTMV